MAAHQTISDEDWSQLMTLASGFLTLEDGDIAASMSRALAAHAALIQALKDEIIIADLGPGTVTMFVPEEGGVALRMDRHAALDDEESEIPTQGLPDLTAKQPRATTYFIDEDLDS